MSKMMIHDWEFDTEEGWTLRLRPQSTTSSALATPAHIHLAERVAELERLVRWLIRHSE